MANNRRMSRVLRAPVEQRFQPSGWTFQEERPDAGTLRDHGIQIT